MYTSHTIWEKTSTEKQTSTDGLSIFKESLTRQGISGAVQGTQTQYRV